MNIFINYLKVVLWKAGAVDQIVLFETINVFSCDINFCRKKT